MESSFLVEVADDEAPPSFSSGDMGEVGSLSSMSESGDLRPGIAPGCGVPPLEVVLRSCGEPTLESWYFMLTLAAVRGAGVTPPPGVWWPGAGPGDLLEPGAGADREVVLLEAGAYSECGGGAAGGPGGAAPPAPAIMPV